MSKYNPSTDNSEEEGRRQRMRVLANSDSEALVRRWRDLGIDPPCEILRGPEVGIVAVQGRMAGTGSPFIFGEATVTRATVRLGNGAIGHAMMLGREKTKAKLAAVIDALAQDEAMAGRIEETVIAPLAAVIDRADKEKRDQTAATKVEFFTMVRGED